MRRGTTPTYIMRFSTGLGEKIDNISLSFVQGQTKLHTYLSTGKITLENDTASVTLLQEETKLFSPGILQRQVKIKLKDEYGGLVQTTAIATESVYEQLNEVIL